MQPISPGSPGNLFYLGYRQRTLLLTIKLVKRFEHHTFDLSVKYDA